MLEDNTEFHKINLLNKLLLVLCLDISSESILVRVFLVPFRSKANINVCLLFLCIPRLFNIAVTRELA